MQVVINIDEDEYRSICVLLGTSKRIGVVAIYNRFHEMIANGTPLPKGHGDLIDRGKLKTHFIGTEQGTDLEVYLEPTIINAPTIVGAESRDEDEL